MVYLFDAFEFLLKFFEICKAYHILYQRKGQTGLDIIRCELRFTLAFLVNLVPIVIFEQVLLELGVEEFDFYLNIISLSSAANKCSINLN